MLFHIKGYESTDWEAKGSQRYTESLALEPKTMQSDGAPLCNTCGEQVGLNDSGEVFVACHQCSLPICKECFEQEISEGHKACLRCGTPYEEGPKDVDVVVDDDDDDEIKVSENQSTMASEISSSQDVGLHARHVSAAPTVDSEVNDESGNSSWKNRVKSWKGKDKKNKKKKAAPTDKNAAPVPPEQRMEDTRATEAAAAPLSVVIPISKSKLTPYRIVIIMRLTILGLFFHYRVTNLLIALFLCG